ncbi:porin [Photobacterium damselae]|uniref:porin n=1 Tax=Photobacterium damselae TaxID=38293 RepID=UPI001EFE9BD0|nr:porin [Photobacterium damselae]MCG9703703.1 porin [Photobacterium damselae]
MKKTLLALAVVTAAGSAQAGVNLYDNNGVKVDLSGAAEVQYRNTYNPFDDAELRLDDGDLALNTTVAVNDQLNAIAGIAFKFEETKVENDELWVGLSSNQFGALTFGRQLLIIDDSGIGKDYELGSEGIDFVQTDGNEVIKYVYDNGMFYAGVSHELKNSDEVVVEGNNNSGALVKQHDTQVTDARLGFRTNGLDARVYYYNGDNIDGTSFFKNSFMHVEGYNLEAEYQLGQIGLAASFGQIEYKNASNADKLRGNIYQVAADYTIDATTFAVGYNNYDRRDESGDTYALYANVTQQLHSNVKVYAEIGHSNAKFSAKDADKFPQFDAAHGKDAEFGYVAGMEVTF